MKVRVSSIQYPVSIDLLHLSVLFLVEIPVLGEYTVIQYDLSYVVVVSVFQRPCLPPSERPISLAIFLQRAYTFQSALSRGLRSWRRPVSFLSYLCCFLSGYCFPDTSCFRRRFYGFSAILCQALFYCSRPGELPMISGELQTESTFNSAIISFALASIAQGQNERELISSDTYRMPFSDEAFLNAAAASIRSLSPAVVMKMSFVSFRPFISKITDIGRFSSVSDNGTSFRRTVCCGCRSGGRGMSDSGCFPPIFRSKYCP